MSTGDKFQKYKISFQNIGKNDIDTIMFSRPANDSFTEDPRPIIYELP